MMPVSFVCIYLKPCYFCYVAYLKAFHQYDGSLFPAHNENKSAFIITTFLLQHNNAFHSVWFEEKK